MEGEARWTVQRKLLGFGTENTIEFRETGAVEKRMMRKTIWRSMSISNNNFLFYKCLNIMAYL